MSLLTRWIYTHLGYHEARIVRQFSRRSANLLTTGFRTIPGLRYTLTRATRRATLDRNRSTS